MKRKCPGRNHRRGFTLIELMVTISILAILVSIAIPSFTSTIRRNQIATAANNLVGALALARSEASKRSVNVTVCASDTSNAACSGSTAWNNGWVIFTDTCVIGTIDCGDTILSRSTTSSSGISIAGSDSTLTYVPTGELTNRAVPPPDPTFVITKNGCGTGEMRTITVLVVSGRNNLKQGDCP